MDIPPQIKYAQGDNSVQNDKSLSTKAAAPITTKTASNVSSINSNLQVCSDSHPSTFEDPPTAISTQRAQSSIQSPSEGTATHAAQKSELKIFARNPIMDSASNKDEGLASHSDILPVETVPSADSTITESLNIKTTSTTEIPETEQAAVVSHPLIQPSFSNTMAPTDSKTLNSCPPFSSISNPVLSERTNNIFTTPTKSSSANITPSPGISALGSSSVHTSGKPKPSLKDILYSSTAPQTAFSALIDRIGTRPGPNLAALSNNPSTAQFSDGLMRPLATQSQLPRPIALPLPLVARHSNEPQFIKPLPEEPPRGMHDGQILFTQALPSFSLGQPITSSSKVRQDSEHRRSSPHFESLDKKEDSSHSPRKGRRPRKYVRSGKYSKLKSKGSEEGDCSPCLSSQTTAPAHYPVSRPTEYTPTDSSAPPFGSTKSPKEIEHNRLIKERVGRSLHSDRAVVTSPDYSRPFENLKDAFERLVPYHLFQYHDVSLKNGTKVNPSVSKIEKSYKTLKSRLLSLGTKLRDEEKRMLPLSILVDHLLVKDASSLDVRELNNIDNGQSSIAPTTPLFERLSSAAPSEPTIE